MAEIFVLEFEGFGADAYDRVNQSLGINMDSGEGDWPAGLHTHLAGPTEGGGWIVVEVWESQEDQDEFMKTRLGPALAQGWGHRRAEAGGVDEAQSPPHAEEGLREGEVTSFVNPGGPHGSRRFGHAAARCYAHALRGAFARATTITMRAGEWR